MTYQRLLPLIALLALLLPRQAKAAVPRDTVYVSERYTTHVLMPSPIASAEADGDAPLVIAPSAARPEMMAIRAREPFAGIVTVTVEDPAGAFRLVAVAYAARPDRILADLRPGGTDNRYLGNTPVIGVTRSRAMLVRFPGRVVYADLGAVGLLNSEVTGKGRNELTMKAPRAFADSTNITFYDTTGTLHMFLVRYVKSLRTTSMTLRADPDAMRPADFTDVTLSGAATAEAPAPRLAARDTVSASRRFTTHVVFPAPLREISVPEGASFTMDILEGRPDVAVLRAGRPFEGAVTVTAEDATGAWRLVAVRYEARPGRLVADLRRDGALERRLADAPLVEASSRKAFRLRLPEAVTYADFGAVGVLAGEVSGEGKSDVSLKAAAPFQDTTNVTLADASGNMYSCLVKYRKTLKVQELDLRPAPAPQETAPETKVPEGKGKPEAGQKEQKEQKEKKEADKEKEKERDAARDADGGIFAVPLGEVPQAARPAREAAPRSRAGNRDTVWVSDVYTTHLIFGTDLGYADLSNPAAIAAKVVEQSKNKLAIKARGPFQGTANVSMEEANGTFHTFIVAYDPEPDELIVDCRPGAALHPTDSLRVVGVSDRYTTHLIFATDISYADLSRPSALTGKLVDQGRNKLALTARAPFRGRANVSVEEANGVFHTYLLEYAAEPSTLVVDTKDEIAGGGRAGAVTDSRDKEAGHRTSGSLQANALRKRDAPLLSDVIAKRQTLWHTGVRKHRLTLMCENVFSYSDITYLVLSLDNASGISYEAEDVMFVIETTSGVKRRVLQELNVFPKNRFGSLTVPAGGKGRMAFSFDKITMSDGQVMKIYLYEAGGNRHLVLTLSAKDINGAISPYDVK